MRLKTTVTLAAVALALSVTAVPKRAPWKTCKLEAYYAAWSARESQDLRSLMQTACGEALISTSAVPQLLLFLAMRARLKP